MKIKDISNDLFKFFLIFCILFFWLNYYLRNGFKTFIFSSIISISLFLLIKYYENKKYIKDTLSKKDEENILNIQNQLLYNSNKNNKIYLQNLLNLNKKMQLNINGKLFLIIPFLSNKTISEFELSIAFKQCITNNISNAIIICHNSPQNIVQLATSIKECELKILYVKSLYLNFIKPLNKFPNKIITIQEKKKYKFKELLNLTFSKKNSKKFIKLGFLTYFLSLFTFYKLYYMIIGTMLFGFSLICKLKNRNKAPKKSELDFLTLNLKK